MDSMLFAHWHSVSLAVSVVLQESVCTGYICLFQLMLHIPVSNYFACRVTWVKPVLSWEDSVSYSRTPQSRI